MLIDKERIKKDFKHKLTAMFAEDMEEASPLHKYITLGRIVKEYCIENLLNTNKMYKKQHKKQVYYFSMEFLIGRLLESNLMNLGIKEQVYEALKDLGIDLNEIIEVECDAGLGNGGLGRLAACFLDSMASLGIAGHGCGIRYKYGLFEQKIVDGYQVEVPDNWLKYGNIWENREKDKAEIVNFGGEVSMVEENGRVKPKYKNCEEILAVPYKIPIVGYKNDIVNTLMLWSAETVDKEFDLKSFNEGDYSKANEYNHSITSISQILYPDDSNEKGKLLRLKQEYFFVSAGIQSIIRSYEKTGLPLNEFHKHNAIHINDTHPSVAVAELMRILIDEKDMCWDEAWAVTVKTMAYTNHTIMAEALEKWKVTMFKAILPRIYMIVEEINKRFCAEAFHKCNSNWEKVHQVSIVRDGYIYMSHLAIVGSHSVNGVAKIHTEILKNQELSNFYNLYKERFNNKTNGITHRRWLIQANPQLTALLKKTIGDSWICNPLKLKDLEAYVNSKDIQEEFLKVKTNNKINFSNYLNKKYDISIDPNSIFDVQVKRLHAYKRQLLNVMHIMDLYNRLLQNPNLDITPRTFIFGAKASPGYQLAKQVIKLINSTAYKINNDKTIGDKIKVVFIENYGVSIAEKIIPCADVSEQISTASKEASGTGNMKFMMNGAVSLATLDGANVEIAEAVGKDNIVLFGLSAEQVISYYKNNEYYSRDIYNNDERVRKILTQWTNGFLQVPNWEFNDICNHLLSDNDEFFVLKDLNSYINAQNTIDKLYRDKNKWQEMSMINIANSGIFSSDNTIKNYAKEIWQV